jgi:RNA 3'-terminal phosphate cyclase (ATP)
VSYTMIEIDGSSQSGSGTLLRYSVALATLSGETLHLSRIRAKRPKPGLRAQHLAAVRACARLSGAEVEGDEVGSQEILYRPGRTISGGDFRFDIGTAGSAVMAAFALIPPALAADGPSRITITGGLFQDFAPTFFHMQQVLVPMLRMMGADVNVRMVRPGYVPDGQGMLVLEVKPVPGLVPLHLSERGKVISVKGIALSSHLREQQVGQRMAGRCRELLKKRGYRAMIDIVDDTTAVQRGAGLTLWAETERGCRIGADRAGRQGRRSEAIADFTAKSLLEDLGSGASTDRHTADQLILFAALAEGATEYVIPRVTDHVEANLWLVEKVLGIRASLRNHTVRIQGKGMAIDR